ncbi:hypothetical protein LQZ24_00905 [Fructobacillus sp. M1-13]|uniref:ATP-grasp domain-containing protein n=1 Tax=Fructobacillus papyriferae TaxID=2713171 RepID=A0ABS5QP00_9LACO|nr:hypothetical protein [Fructobacillus papyriferae]MBS9334597.1 hypothetical protein [Fructobacillus papyriferae]MCD2158586.1 hypothetical protein [Fructobacillus papyriferae]
MNYYIWPYSPHSLSLIEDHQTIVLTSEENRSHFVDWSDKAVFFFDELSFETLFAYFRQHRGHSIDRIWTLDEEKIIWVSQLNNLFATQRDDTAILFKDKYFMRSALQDIVLQPRFQKASRQQPFSGKGFLKYRRSDSAQGVEDYQDDSEYQQLLLQIPEVSWADYMVEEAVSYDTMYTIDGYRTATGQFRLFAHEYYGKVNEVVHGQYLLLTTASLYQKPELLKRLFTLSKRVVNQLSRPGDTVPFHIEWFYQKDRNRFVFTEIGRRFGGGHIPRLIQEAFGINLLQEYWANLNKTTTFNEQLLYPKCYSATYFQMHDGRALINTHFLNEFQNVFGQQVHDDSAMKAVGQSVNDNYFALQFRALSTVQLQKQAALINERFKEENPR